MGRAPCCDKANVKKGPWSPDEDAKLKDYIEKHGTGGNWIALPLKAGLKRCGKSCRLRWLNYLRPNIRHGDFTDDEDRIIYTLFASIGSRWSIIAAQLPGRTDNDIKNYWNTKLKKKILSGLNITQLNKKMLLLQQSSDTSSYPLKPSHDVSLTANTLASTSQYSSAQHSQIVPPLVKSSSSYYEKDHHQPMLVNSSYYNTSRLFALQAQDGDDRFSNSMHGNGYDITDHQVRKGCSSSNNLLMFRNEAAASSSSDGSCVTNHSKLGLQSSYFGNGVCNYVGDHHGYSSSEAAQGNGLFSSDQQIGSFDYSIEEIKQLMSSGVSNNFNFFVDEYIIKTEEATLDK